MTRPSHAARDRWLSLCESAGTRTGRWIVWGSVWIITAILVAVVVTQAGISAQNLALSIVGFWIGRHSKDES